MNRITLQRLRESGLTVIQIAHAFEVTPKTVYNRLVRDPLPRGGTKRKTLDQNGIAWLRNIVMENPTRSRNWFRNAVQEELSVNLSARSISNYLRRDCQLTRKKATALNNRVLNNDVMEKGSTFSKALAKHGRDVYAFDESAFYLIDVRGTGYAPRGEPLVAKVPTTSTGRTLNLILMIHRNLGVVAWDTYPSNTNAKKVAAFLQAHLHKGGAVIMDNASTHRTSDVKEVLQVKNVTAVYSPPYSPQLNPTEYCFSVIKRHVRSLAPESARTLKEAIDKCIRTLLTPEKIAHMFDHVAKISRNPPPL
jgi:transposase